MIKIFDETSLNEDLNKKKILYLYFYSPGCGPCKITSPLVQEFGNSIEDIVYIVNSREAKELQNQLEVFAYPSLIIIKNNKVIKGGVGQDEVTKIIKDGTSNK
jgi:thioredoxin 1